MATTDANGQVFYGPTDPVEPLQGILNGVSTAVSSKLGAQSQIVRIPNVAGRAAAVTARAGRAITAADPLIVWRADATPGSQIEYTMNGTNWVNYDVTPVYSAMVPDVILVNVSTMSFVINLDLPADAPAGQYIIDADMISRSDAAVPTYVRVDFGGTTLPGVANAMDNPAHQDVARSVHHSVRHSGGAVRVRLGLQINGGSVAWNRAKPGTSLRVTRIGP